MEHAGQRQAVEMRAYLRIDPELTDKKERAGYPDGALAAFITLLCAGEQQQPERGRFKTLAVLKAALGRRAKFVPFLLAKGDLVTLEDGRFYIDGWDEWQEGDWTVRERVNRIRDREKVTPRAVTDVTPRAVNTSRFTAIAVGGRHLAVGISDSGSFDPASVDSRARDLTERLSGILDARGVRFTVGKAWYVEAERLLRVDGRDFTEASELLVWATNDSFWQSVILSPSSFRRHYDKLRLQRERGRSNGISNAEQSAQRLLREAGRIP